MLVLTDADGACRDASRPWLEFTGRALEDQLGGGWLEGADERDREELTVGLAHAAESGLRFAYDARFQRSDGEWRVLAFSAVPRLGSDGRAESFAASFFDITSRKETARRLRETSLRLETLIDALPEPVVLKDGAGRWQTVNREAASLFGLELVDWKNRTNEELAMLVPGARETFLSATLSDERAWSAGERYDSVDQLSDLAGLPVYLETSRIPLESRRGKRTGLVLLGRNVTGRRFADEALRLAADVFDESPDGILVADRDRRIVRVNPAFCRITGYTPEEVLGRNPRFLASGRHDKEYYAAMWRGIEATGRWSGEIWNRRRSGEVYPEWLTIVAFRGEGGQVERYHGSFSDIGERKAIEAERERYLFRDALTSLATPAFFRESVAAELRGGAPGADPCALLVADIDGLAKVNAAHGHAHGDDVVREVSARLAASVRRGLVGRWYGSAFTAFVRLDRSRDGEPALALAGLLEGIRTALSEPMLALKPPQLVSTSVGVAVSSPEVLDADELIESAEAALRRAKVEASGSFRVNETGMHGAVDAQLVLDADLRKAVRRREMAVYFQPIVDVARGAVTGAEALLRWNHPVRGQVPPDRFIPFAEASGTIHELGRFAVRTACRNLAAWRASGLPIERVDVNVSGRQLLDSSIVPFLEETLADNGLAPGCLGLELTESDFVPGDTATLGVLDRLRSLGVRIAIDDFGTGFSALQYLKRLPVDVLKIDRSFVQGLPGQPKDAAIVKAILALASGLGLSCVAEGVESSEQAGFLAHHGCDELQGYLFGAGVPAGEIPAVVGRAKEKLRACCAGRWNSATP